MLEIGRLSGGVGGASALLLSSVWESVAKLLGTEKIAFFALSNCELMALVAEERIIHALKSGLFDAARESVQLKSIFRRAFTGPCRINRAIVCIGFERRDIPRTLKHTVAFRLLSAIILAYRINGRRIRMEENSFQGRFALGSV